MSWKGFQKGLVRTPQNLRQKMNKGNVTKDLVYLDAEDRFSAIETETKKLQTEARRYWNAINNMLAHQIRYSEILETVYQPISGRLSDPNEVQSEEGHSAGIAACQQYRTLVTEIQALLRPEMEMIETRIIRPAEEMLTITDSIKKMFVKRDHKQVDLDRHAQSLKKAQDKNDHSVKHEEKVYKVEKDYELALEEYNYYNNLLKEELPKLFELQGNFMRPLFQSLYYMQINIFYTLHTHMEEMKIPYFDTQGDIVQTFEQKRGNVLAQTENIGITQFKRSQKKSKFNASNRKLGRHASSASSTANAVTEDDDFSDDPWGDSDDEAERPPRYIDEAPVKPARPVRGEKQEYIPHTSAVPPLDPPLDPPGGSVEPPKPPKPPRPHKPAPTAEVCVALYDFTAQAAGDLTFTAGDRIEIIERTQSQEGWWKGALRGQQGVFPANYVQLA